MDVLRLLSRSTKVTKGKHDRHKTTPSSGQNAPPQLLPIAHLPAQTSKKRKRSQDAPTTSDDGPDGLDFFGVGTKPERRSRQEAIVQSSDVEIDADTLARDEKARPTVPAISVLSQEEAQTILKQHKVKITWLNSATQQRKNTRKGKDGSELGRAENPLLFPSPLQSLRELQPRFAMSRRLAANLDEQGYTQPTEVQLGSLPILMDASGQYLALALWSSKEAVDVSQVDLLTVAPTGTGKTLAFMIPVLHRIQQAKVAGQSKSRKTAAIILAPTKELVGQITNEGRKLAEGTGIRVIQLRKGMSLAVSEVGNDGFRDNGAEQMAGTRESPMKADVLVSTPGLLQSLLSGQDMSRAHALSDVRHMVLDEADVLLDPLFREQTLDIWNALPNPELRVSLWSATMGSNIEELAWSTIDDRRRQIGLSATTTVQEAPLVRLVVGLKDSAVPNVEHRLVYAATEQGKLMGLRQLLHPAAVSADSGPPLLPPFLIFTQTIERAVALHSELLYDIPAEAGGISRIAVLHSDLSDVARDSVMTRFRKGEIWVLITTDLLSRGVDFRGINGVVNYDIPTSSAAYVHRVGRTGRAGREGGVAVTLYSKEDIPYLKHVANVVTMAQKHKGTKTTDAGLQQWLLDALPKLSKQEKQKLKKRGVESRAAQGKDLDPKAARRGRISSKAGFLRRAENNRRGAVLGSQRRAQAEAAAEVEAADEADVEAEFAGFD